MWVRALANAYLCRQTKPEIERVEQMKSYICGSVQRLEAKCMRIRKSVQDRYNSLLCNYYIRMAVPISFAACILHKRFAWRFWGQNSECKRRLHSLWS